jgi:hypothetical protein
MAALFLAFLLLMSAIALQNCELERRNDASFPLLVHGEFLLRGANLKKSDTGISMAVVLIEIARSINMSFLSETNGWGKFWLVKTLFILSAALAAGTKIAGVW